MSPSKTLVISIKEINHTGESMKWRRAVAALAAILAVRPEISSTFLSKI